MMGDMSEKRITGWHFASTTLRDGSPLPPTGTTLKHLGDVVPCQSGYHASERAIDALNYAPGLMVARVELTGAVIAHGELVDKYVASERTNLTEYRNCGTVLVALSRIWALRALRVHAANALRPAGLTQHADTLAELADDCDLTAASYAASYASEVARYASEVARYASRAAHSASRAARSASDFASDFASDSASDFASYAASYVSRAASDSASYAARSASDFASDASDAERGLQNTELESALTTLLEAK